jgi:CrcB protein
MAEAMWVALGGIVGAVARFLIGKWTARHYSASFPVSTLFINFVGSLIISVFLIWTSERVLADPRWRLLVAIGFCGAFTTFSSYAFETFKLFEQGAFTLAALNVLANNLAALAAVIAGAIVARRIG